MFKLWLIGTLANLGMLGIFNRVRKMNGVLHLFKDSCFAKLSNNLGEDAPPAVPPATPPNTFTQQQVDGMIQQRLTREKEKFANYDELAKFKTDHEASTEAQTQKDLESKQQYEAAQKVNLDKIIALESIISGHKTQIEGMKIDQSLGNEINKQNGFLEESLALLKSSVTVNETGVVMVKGKDSNNIDTLLSVEQGVKQFLESKPHLVKATQNAGAGTHSSPDGTVVTQGTANLEQLNLEYQQKLNIRDIKGAEEVRTKIQTILNAKGGNVVGV